MKRKHATDHNEPRNLSRGERNIKKMLPAKKTPEHPRAQICGRETYYEAYLKSHYGYVCEQVTRITDYVNNLLTLSNNMHTNETMRLYLLRAAVKQLNCECEHDENGVLSSVLFITNEGIDVKGLKLTIAEAEKDIIKFHSLAKNIVFDVIKDDRSKKGFTFRYRRGEEIFHTDQFEDILKSSRGGWYNSCANINTRSRRQVKRKSTGSQEVKKVQRKAQKKR